MVILHPQKCRAGKNQQCKPTMKPDDQTFTPMEFNNGQPRSTRPASHPLSTARSTPGRPRWPPGQSRLTAMCNTGAMMNIMGRSMLNKLKMNKSKLVKVTKRLVAAIGDQIALNGAVFLDLAHRDKKTTQMVYVLTQQTA